ncbi:MAG TPA: type III secretion inner membrane ring lipoprotein SctJ [Burkholderiaceae bacterium]
MQHPNSWPRLAAGAALLLALAGCKVELYSGLGESDANEIVAALADGRIAARKEHVDGADWQVQVDEDRVGAALELLRAQGLPEQHYASMGDMFQKQGLVSTPAEERMRYIFAVSQELSHTLRSIDGVVEARVHVVIPQDDPLSDKVRPSSAAVFIKHRPDVDLRLLAPAVKDLVAHSIEGLSPDRVALTLFPAPRAASLAAGPAPEDVPREVLGMSQRAVVTLLVLPVMAAIAIMALPTLLSRRGLDWRTWLQREVLRR